MRRDQKHNGAGQQAGFTTKTLEIWQIVKEAMAEKTRGEDPRARPAKRRGPGVAVRCWRLCAGLLSAALILVIVLIGGVYMRLAAGPISLAEPLSNAAQASAVLPA